MAPRTLRHRLFGYVLMWLVLLADQWQTGAGGPYSEDYMVSWRGDCAASVNLLTAGGRLHLAPPNVTSVPPHCVTHVMAAPGCQIYFNMASSSFSPSATLKVYEGLDDDDDDFMAIYKKYFSTVLTSRTEHRFLTIEFLDYNPIYSGDSAFTMDFTETTDDAGTQFFKKLSGCSPGGAAMFRCSNGWLVARSLTCDGVDNCGDGSDESYRGADCASKPLPAAPSAAYLLAVVLAGCGGVLVTACLCCCWYCCCCRRKDQPGGTTETKVIYRNSEANPAYNPNYGTALGGDGRPDPAPCGPSGYPSGKGAGPFPNDSGNGYPRNSRSPNDSGNGYSRHNPLDRGNGCPGGSGFGYSTSLPGPSSDHPHRGGGSTPVGATGGSTAPPPYAPPPESPPPYTAK